MKCIKLKKKKLRAQRKVGKTAPQIVTFVWAHTSTWQKGKTNLRELSSDLHTLTDMHTGTHAELKQINKQTKLSTQN